MSKVVQFPDPRSVAEEASQWLIRLDADTPPTQAELKDLGEWLQRSPAHREKLEALAGLWGRMNVLTELAVPLEKYSRPPTDKQDEGQAARGRSQWRWTGLRLTYALASLFIVAVTVGALLQTRAPASDPLLATNGLYATAVGQQETTRLADGSEVMLNTNSQIRVSYDGAYRDVVLLQGEALFTVAKNADRPFRVSAGNGRVEAIGTAFSVYLKGNDVNVTVAEGRVSLASVNLSRSKDAMQVSSAAQGREPANSAVDTDDDLVELLGTLNAGQVATIRSAVAETAGGGSLEIAEPVPPEDLAARLAWRDGILMFSGDRLEDVIEEVGRYTTLSIEIPDEAVRNMRIGGRFRVDETDALFTALEANFNLHVTHVSHSRVVLSAAGE